MKKLLIMSMMASALAITTGSQAEATVIKDVSFKNQNSTLIGKLYLPDEYKSGDKLPAVVVTGAWTTVKEQMPATYAEKLAANGFAALIFDFRGWGESKDEVRYLILLRIIDKHSIIW